MQQIQPMKTLFNAILLLTSIKLLAQPVEVKKPKDQSESSKPYLICARNEREFAQNAAEAQSSIFEISDTINCKLHLPFGINKIATEIEKSKMHKKGEYDYSKDFWIGIRFNFYVDGVKVSTAYHDFENPKDKNASYTYSFSLYADEYATDEGSLNFAYIALLKSLKNPNSSIVIEAAMPSKNLVTKSFVPITNCNFTYKIDPEKHVIWKNQTNKEIHQQAVENETPIPTNYNIRLQYIADSTMKSLFGEIGFKKYFKTTCLQNPCEDGYFYANTMVTNKPCTTQPQSTCKEAIVTYKYVNQDVPLTVKMLITIKDNGDYIYIEDNQYGKKEIAIEKQNLLSTEEMKFKINQLFPNHSISMPANDNILTYFNTPIKQPENKQYDKINRDPGYRLIKETIAGKSWKNGFVYTAFSSNPNKLQQVYFFNAVSGELLWITEIYVTTN